ncbi:MAG: aldose 1-epimerase [Candidatus Solibacter usitatus]|nr:aldose 1-epimerase [Candidatus Solibacter usitatus]
MRTALLALTIPLMSQAAPYSIQKQIVDSVEVYVLRDEARATEVRVAPSLGNNSYEMTVKGKRVFWSPYRTLGEFAAKPAHLGNPFLWPWANRVDGASYFVNEKKYSFNFDLGNIRQSPANAPIHGLLVYSKLWQVTRADASPDSAVLTSRLEFWRRPELMAQFPFAHSVEMTYRLKNGVLEVETAVENLSAEALPISLGFHPYFQLNDSPRDEWRVHIPAKERHALSSRLVPTGERLANPFPDPVSLGGTVLDDVFDSLVRDSDGFARFWVQGKTEKITVEYGPKYTVAVVYSPAGRGFICFEPMSGITNVFNAAHDGWYKGLQSVAPGATWREVFRVVPSGF